MRPDGSGPIRLVSRRRHERLRSHGRLPCPHCASWPTGTRGLWWHGLAVHGIEYSIATVSAAGIGACDSSAIVPWEGGAANREESAVVSAVPTMARQRQRTRRGRYDDDEDDDIDIHVSGLNNRADDEMIQSNGAFEMVKMGKYDEFLRFLDVRERDSLFLHFFSTRSSLPVRFFHRMILRFFSTHRPVLIPQQKGSFCPRTRLNRNGASALHWAAGCGRLDFVSHLVEGRNCCPNQGQNGKRSFLGRTPLHW